MWCIAFPPAHDCVMPRQHSRTQSDETDMNPYLQKRRAIPSAIDTLADGDPQATMTCFKLTVPHSLAALAVDAAYAHRRNCDEKKSKNDNCSGC